MGKIVQANGGTRFLDEIGDMSAALPAHVRRRLQVRQVRPLGSGQRVAVEVSIICATHRNVRDMIDRQAFREDPFYRLDGLAVRLPPLRECSDLLALVRRILDQPPEHDCEQRHLQPDADVLRLFNHCRRPANLFPLFHVLHTAAVMATDEAVNNREHLSDDSPEESRAAQASDVPAAPLTGPAWSVESAAPRRSPEETGIDAIRHAVAATGGHPSKASKWLGISRNTLHRKLRWNQPA